MKLILFGTFLIPLLAWDELTLAGASVEAQTVESAAAELDDEPVVMQASLSSL